MKRNWLVLLLVVILSLSFVGCAQDGGDTGPTTTPTAKDTESTATPSTTDTETGSQKDIYNYYEGYMDLEKGMWAEWENTIGGQQSTNKYVYAGKETIDGKEVVGYEYGYEMEGQEVTVQTWASASTNKPVKSVIKTQDQVLCYSIPDIDLPSTETPSDYKPQEIAERPEWSHGTFTTDSGKTVNVIKFYETQEGKNYEVWVSSEVPFGLVKTVQDGKTVMELKDFGTNAELSISLDDVESCKEMTIPSNIQ